MLIYFDTILFAGKLGSKSDYMLNTPQTRRYTQLCETVISEN